MPTFRSLRRTARSLLAGLLAGLLAAVLLATSVLAGPGDLDCTFGTFGRVTAPVSAGALQVFDADSALYASGIFAGKIVVAGSVRVATEDFIVARFDADGSLDPGFSGDGISDAIDFAGGTDLATGVTIQSDGKAVVAGRASVAGIDYLALARFNTDGTLDTSFGSGGKVSAQVGMWGSSWWDIAVDASDNLYVAGSSSPAGSSVPTIVKLSPSGTVLATHTVDFGTGQGGSFKTITIHGGQILAGGDIGVSTGIYRMTVARLSLDGALDMTFDDDGKKIITFDADSYDRTTGIVVQGDGKVLVSGHVKIGGVNDFAVVRLNADGSFDTTFSVDGMLSIDADGDTDYQEGLILQSDGKIVLGGYASGASTIGGDFVALRLSTDGTLDSTFGTGGKVFISFGDVDDRADAGIHLQPDGKILLAGRTWKDGVYELALARLSSQSADMAYGCGTTVQESGDIFPNMTGGIIGMQMCLDGDTSPLAATSFTFDTTGTTDVTDIASAKVFYTGDNPGFAQTSLFGEISNPSGSFTITGTQTLDGGMNYFWLAYAVADTAPVDAGHVVDAQCTSYTLGGAAFAPDVTSPAGNRPIVMAAYPDITGDPSDGDYISNVTFGSIDNTTGADTNGYGNYTAQSADVMLGSSEVLSVTVSMYDTAGTYIRAWIDWNRNYDFSDPGEEYIVGDAVTTDGPHALSIAIPADASQGATRLRVAQRWAAVPLAGGSLDYGEAEDYTINVLAANAAPTRTGATASLAAVTEDATDPPGATITALFSGLYSDPDSDPFAGVAVVTDTASAASEGHWQYDGSGGWTDLPAVSDASALVITPTVKLRFLPLTDFSGTPGGLTVRLWDGTSGSAGTARDIRGSIGGAGAFSDDSNTVALGTSVTGVNDAPLLSPVSPTMTSIMEDDTSNTGHTVAEIVGTSISDADPSAEEGIAVFAADVGTGSWEYSIGAGTTWFPLGAVGQGSALVLRANDHLRLVPDGENGTSASVTYYAWDVTSGDSAGSKVDVSTRGDETAFSVISDTASITVTSVNDAPVLTPIGPAMTDLVATDTDNAGESIAILIGSSIDDVDSGALGGIAIYSADPGSGTWQYSTDGGTTWIPFGTVSTGSALLLTPTALVRLVPDGSTATSASFSYHAWDQTAGTGGGTADVSTTGGTTAFSTATDTASISVALPNQAPAALDDTDATDELTAILIDVLANDTDPDVGDTLSITTVGLASHGATDTDGSAVLYTPLVGFSGTDVFTYTVSDGGLSDEGSVEVEVTPALALSITDGGDPISAGSALGYTIAITNLSASSLTQLVVTDTLPIGTWFASASHGGTLVGEAVVWTVAGVASGQTVTVDLVLGTFELLRGTVVNEVWAHADGATAGASEDTLILPPPTPTPTATPVDPTPTPTATIIVEEPTATPTATVAPPPRIWLPLVLR